MTSIINASTTAGVVVSPDTSGSLALQANGTNIATVQSTGMTISSYSAGTSLITSGTAQASTSGTAITFTGIPSWVKRITIMYKGISTSGTNALLVQIGSGSVSTSGYSSSSFGGAVGNVLAGNNSATGFLNANSLVAANTHDGICVLVNITGNSWVASSNLTNTNTSSVGFIGTGSIALSGVLDRVSITTVGSTDTFDAGSINILYE